MSRTESLVVLGGADGSVGAYLRARELGYRTICVDVRTDAPAAAVADELVEVSVREPERIAAALAGRTDVVGVLCPASDAGVPAQAWLTRHWGLPHPLPDAAVAASVDKAVFRRLLGTLDLPRYASVAGVPGRRLAARGRPLEFPVLVKPVDSSGSRGIEQVAAPAQLAGAFARAVAFSRVGRVVVEEYVEGAHLSVEALVVGGAVAFHAVTRRTVTPPPNWVTTAHRTPARLPPGVEAHLVEALTAVCAALEYLDGPLTADAVLGTDGRLYLVEMAARLGGNGLAELVESAYGVDLVGGMIALATGRTPVLHPHPAADASAVMLTATDGGQVVAVEGAERVRAMPEVQRLYVFAAEGDIVHPYEQAGHKLGYVVLRAGSPADLHRAEHAVRETLALRLAPSDESAAVGWP
jgi:biotin carboxylase